MRELILRGNQVYIRQPEFSEMGYIRRLWADAKTMKEVGGPIHLTDEQAKAWYEKMFGDEGQKTNLFCLIYDLEGDPIGEVSFHRYDEKTKTAGFNIKVEANKRRKGNGREALELLLNYYFNVFGGEVMQDDVRITNIIGQKMLLNSGFAHIGTTPEAFIVQMTKEEFNKRKISSN